MELSGLKTSHAQNPLGIDRLPYFSWVMNSPEQNVMQNAYRLTVSRDGETVWDSAVTESSQSCFVPYDGPALQSRTRYQWAVTVSDNKGKEATASAWFETALLCADEWKATWVASPFPFSKRKLNWGNQPPATLFRREFTLKKGIAQARLYATCHGVYRLTVNGERPDDRELAPEFTSYRKVLFYQTYDVTGLLQTGGNTLDMMVGDGWYCGPMTAFRGCRDTRHAALFQLEVRYDDGSTQLICSGKGVEAATGPVLFSDLFAGEKYDANAEYSRWVPAKPVRYTMDNLAAQTGPPVRPVATVAAVRVYTSPKGESIVDFGQNLAGRIRMQVDAPRGTEITLDHFEAPDRDGNYFNNILVTSMGPLCEQRVVYISDGTPRVFEALFTFHGFRYVRVSGLAEVRPEDFTAVALSSDTPDAGTFTCSDTRLNRLVENTRWSQRSNMLSIPTDCPQREKGGWTNDAQVYAATAMLNADMTTFYTRWLRNMACEQHRDGRIPITVPYTRYYALSELLNLLQAGQTGMVGASGFGDAALIVPYAMYRITGNTLILREHYRCMKGWCDYIIRASARRGDRDMPRETEKYLWNTGYQYGEWMIPSLFKSGYTVKEDRAKVLATSVYTAPVYTWYSLSLMTKIAQVLDRDGDAAYYGSMADKIKAAFAEGIIDAAGNMPFELQGAYVLPLYFDLVPQRHVQHFADKLVSLIRDNGNRLDTGFLATPYLLDALCRTGNEEVAFQLLYQQNGPSWLDQIHRGATTIWESWHCYGEDGNPLPMSMNHYALGCVDDWIYRTISGIEPMEAGFSHFRVQPRPDPSLTYAKRSYRCGFGDIVCEWERRDGQFHLQLIVPCNTTATVILPDEIVHKVGSGSYAFQCADSGGAISHPGKGDCL